VPPSLATRIDHADDERIKARRSEDGAEHARRHGSTHIVWGVTRPKSGSAEYARRRSSAHRLPSSSPSAPHRGRRIFRRLRVVVRSLPL
jgi:hypothetical protein